MHLFPNKAVSLVLFAAAFAAPTLAHTRPSRRNEPSGMIFPLRHRDEASEAIVTDVNQEMTAQYIPEVAAMIKNFPTVWETAKILDNDTAAQQIWESIKSSNIIPSYIKPKGTPDGDFSSFTPTYTTDTDCWWSFHGCTTPKAPNLLPDITICPEPETWGLTFDDGPNASHNAFYDYLLANKQKATMFYIGSNVLDWPLQAQRGLVDGHEVCVHTWSHQYMTALSDEQVFAELYYTAKVIKDIIGITPTSWRPPFGDVDDRVRAIAAGLGLRTIIWRLENYLPGGSEATVDANYNAIFANQSQGAYSAHGTIVLTHEITGDTMDIAMKMYPHIKSSFKYVAPLTACLNNTNPYKEAITYPNFEQYIAGNINATGLPDGHSIKISDSDYMPSKATTASSTAATNASSTNSSFPNGTNAPAVNGKSSTNSSMTTPSRTSSAPGATDRGVMPFWAAAVLVISMALLA